MGDEAKELAAQLRSARSRRDPSGLPADLRRRAGRWLVATRARGETWVSLGSALGVSSTTASNWAREAEAAEGGFLPVQTAPPVAQAAGPDAAGERPAMSPVLVTPRGFRVAGLSPEALVFVLERLG